MKAFGATNIISDHFTCFLLEGEKLIYWVPLVPSMGKIGEEVLDDVIEVRRDVFVENSEPNSCLVVVH